MREILLGLLPLLGVAVGAGLQHWLGRLNDRDEHFARLRHEVYSDYLRAVSEAAASPSKDAIRKVTDAKARMSVYGSDNVLKGLFEFENAGPNLTNKTAQDRFISLALEMRREASASGTAIDAGSLAVVLFGITGRVQSP